MLRDSKLIQYLNEAYGKEKELETALQAHIKMAPTKRYKKRLQDHLKETKAQARGLERRSGSSAARPRRPAFLDPTSSRGRRAKRPRRPAGGGRGEGPGARAARHRGGGGAAENAKGELWNENEEIGNYLAIEALADALGTRRRRSSRGSSAARRSGWRVPREADPAATKAVVTEEVPASERRAAGRSAKSRPAKRASGSRSAKPAKSRAKAGQVARRPSRAPKPAKSRAKRPAKSRAATGSS